MARARGSSSRSRIQVRVLLLALALWVLPGLHPATAQQWYYTRLKQFDAAPPPSGPVGNDGSYPRIRLVPDGSGAFLGGTDMGGLLDVAGNGKGTLFTITPDGTFTRIYSFDPAAVYFGQCLTNLVAGKPPDSAFYGLMSVCGPGNLGRIVKLDASTTPPTFTTLYSLSLSSGWDPEGGLAMGSDGWFYGTMLRGGNSDRGTIFRFDPASIQPNGTGFETLHSFDFDHGAEPRGDLVLAADGSFYGTTYTGGAAYAGTIFKLDPTTTPPAFTWLYDFPKNGSGQFFEGSFPLAGVVEWGGYLYGTALFGGADNRGTVFKFDPTAKSMAWVRSFTGTGGAQPGGQPNTKLVLGAGGTILYGTAVVGGAMDSGTVFSITSDGTFTKLYSFSGWDGQSPLELTEVSDGILLGTTYIGAALGGNVFKLEAPGATATVSGGGTICGTGTVDIQAALTGAQPWSVTWSDGVTQSGIATSPVTRSVSPSSTTVYTLTAFSDATGPGTAFGSATVTVSAVPAAPAITAPASAIPGQTGLSASVQSPNGTSTYTWTITNGAITLPAAPPYSGTAITFTAGLAGTTILTVAETNAAGCAGPAGNANVTVTEPPAVTATVGGGGLICGSGSVLIQAALTGTPPWSLTWSDGVSQSGLTTSPAWRYVSPSSTTIYTLTAFSDANGAGTISGSATATVSPPPSPVITTTWVRTPADGWTASVPFVAGRSWTWSVSSSGVIETGQATNEIFFVRALSGGIDVLVTETAVATGCYAIVSTSVGGARRGPR